MSSLKGGSEAWIILTKRKRRKPTLLFYLLPVKETHNLDYWQWQPRRSRCELATEEKFPKVTADACSSIHWDLACSCPGNKAILLSPWKDSEAIRSSSWYFSSAWQLLGLDESSFHWAGWSWFPQPGEYLLFGPSPANCLHLATSQHNTAHWTTTLAGHPCGYLSPVLKSHGMIRWT